MEKVMSVNGLIASLPRIEEKKVWKVVDKNGTVVQYVGSTDNRKRTAQAYINSKYPGQELNLVFSHFKGMMAIPQ